MSIPNIEEMRALAQKRNEQDVIDYMDQVRTAISNGIQQDARNGHSRHMHSWTNVNKLNSTTRSSKNFREAIMQLKKEFEEAGYIVKVIMDGFSETVAAVEIIW